MGITLRNLGQFVTFFTSFIAQSISFPAALDHSISVRSIAHDVFMATDQEYHSSNTLIVKLKDETVFLVSSPFESQGTETLLTWVKDNLKPKRMVALNAHFHMDGTGGNEIYEKNGVETWASDLTQKLQLEKSQKLIQTFAKGYKDDGMKQKLLHSKIVPAKNSFPLEKGKTFHFSGESVEVYFPGPAHSPDNVVIYFPGRNLLFGGCMIKPESLGYLGDADVNRWAASTRNLRKFHPKIVVPGHGPWGGPDLIEKTIEVAEKAAHQKP